MIRHIQLLSILGAFLISIQSFAQVRVSLQVDTAKASTDESIRAEVVVHGVRDLDQKPSLLGINDFSVQDHGVSSSIQFINGRMTARNSFNYTLFPKKEGTFTVGPAEVFYNGKKYVSNKVSLQISKETSTQGNEIKPYFIKGVVDKKSVMVGVPIIYTFQFARKVEVVNANWEPPKFEGFNSERQGDERTFLKTINGERWRMTEISFKLTPLNTGTITIGEASLVAGVVVEDRRRRRRSNSLIDNFFGGGFRNTKKIHLRTKPIEIHVGTLPAYQGDGQNVGHIGRLKVSTQLSKSVLKVGESTTLTIRFEGDGNVNTLKYQLPDLPDFKVYADRPKTEQDPNNPEFSTKVYSYALVPQKEGEVIIPAHRIAFYDLEGKQYDHLTIESKTLSIGKADEKESLNITTAENLPRKAAPKMIQQIGKDLREIVRVPSFHSTLYLLILMIIKGCAFIALPLLYIVLFIKRRSSKDHVEQELNSKKQKAFRLFTKRLEQVSDDNFFVESAGLFRTYIGDKLKTDCGACTPSDMEKLMKSRGCSENLIHQSVQFLKQCEMYIYGGGSGTSVSSQRDALQTLAKQIQREL